MKFLNIKNIILGVLIVLVGYVIFTNNGIRTDVEAYNRKIDSLQNEIDSVENANIVLDGHIDKVDNEINYVETKVTKIQENITEIKIQTHEKVNAVNTYTPSELMWFFTNRYEIGLDSTIKSTDSKTSH
jgi:peptidoglycan hydrolase CwlO-like protein